MNKDYPGVVRALEAGMRDLGKHAPETIRAFQFLFAAAGKPGKLDSKVKELIGVAISIASHCEGCIALHARGAFKAGATRSELVETIGVALEMGGGPAMVYSLAALDAYDQFMQAELSSDKVE
jgi:AhpD family alkylhydroperoxidase